MTDNTMAKRKNDRQHNGKAKRKHDKQQNTTQKTEERATLKTGG